MSADPSPIPTLPLMVGFEGKRVPPPVARGLRDGSLLGVVLFSRNVENPRQVRELCREIRAAAGRGRPSPLIAVDQEGGRVQRLAEPGFTRFPPARCYSTLCCHAERAAEAVAEAIAEELRAVGVDINFAPVLDVDSTPDNPVIGDRSLSSDPSLAARLGISFFRGSLSRGVIPVGKHFPGHGAADADSHETLPVVRSSGRIVRSRDLLPFRRAIRAGIPALMTAHVLFPALDREHAATFSSKILTGMLRQQFRFRGVLFSDALEMGAVTSRYEIGEAAVRAADAGCDVLLVCRGEENRGLAAEALAREARDRPAFRKRLTVATRRIRRLRDLLAAGEPAPERGRRRESLRQAGSRKHRELAALLFERWENTARTSPDDRSGSIGED
jgi:beta-N-acetylhexosaminidase